MASVPLPWWASQSRTRTRSPCSARLAATTAMLLIRQNPIGRVARAWWPGGRTARKAAIALAPPEGLDGRQAGTRGQLPGPPGARRRPGVAVDVAAAGGAEALQRLQVVDGMHPAELGDGGLPGLEQQYRVGQPGRLRAPEGGGEPLDPLGVPRAGVVVLEGGVGGDEEHPPANGHTGRRPCTGWQGRAGYAFPAMTGAVSRPGPPPVPAEAGGDDGEEKGGVEPETIERRGERARLASWRADGLVAHLSPTAMRPLSAGFVDSCLDRLRARGFTVRGHQRPVRGGVRRVPPGRLRRPGGARAPGPRSRRPSPTSTIASAGPIAATGRRVLTVDTAAFNSFWRLHQGGLEDALGATPSVRFRVHGRRRPPRRLRDRRPGAGHRLRTAARCPSGVPRPGPRPVPRRRRPPLDAPAGLPPGRWSTRSRATRRPSPSTAPAASGSSPKASGCWPGHCEPAGQTSASPPS